VSVWHDVHGSEVGTCARGSRDEDVEDIRVMGDRLAVEIPGAERATIAGAAHLPNLEQPEEFDRIVLAFLGKHGV
jgi:pimeloyl-ACP methyl ester carboxylesterase